MSDRIAMTETIARACGWETTTDSIHGVQVFRPEDGEGWERFEPFDPFESADEWFRTFNAMEMCYLRIEKNLKADDQMVWECDLAGGDIRGESEHPDRLTAMGLALHAAARAKLGEVAG